MRLLIDLQAIQGASGRRGIGRYSESLARAIVANAGDHEVLFGFTNQLPVPWKKAAEIGQGRVGRERTITYALPGPVAEVLGTTGARARIAELIREAAIADASPDAVLLSSLFEGHFEHLTTSIGAFDGETPVAVSLYDLIPLVRRETYFTGPTFPAWHMRKVESLRRAQRLLAISQSSKREAVDHLGIAPERIAVVYPAADPFFMPLDGAGEAIEAVRAKYGISGKFVMYTGGIDPRKNVEGMIEGYAALPPRARRERQLVIVCGILNDDRRRLQGFADRRGIAAGGIVFTGHVPDEDLRLFYNCCEVFVCPSLHEGFGLPILEAMACGAPALASNTSSMPEVVGREDALFDPEKPDSIAGKILAVLDDEGLARSLRESGLEQAKRFDRNESAKAAWGVLEEMAGERATRGPKPAEAGRKRRLAYLSPLPPLRSGISDYSAELLPELAKFYDIEVIADQPAIADPWIARNLRLRTVAWFSEFAADFDRVLYNVGNSEFHSHMFDLIERWPGVVILHEFFLSDLYRQLGYRHGAEEWLRRLYDAHGFPALRKFPSLPASEEARRLFPCSEPVFDQATGVITHSQHALELAAERFGAEAATRMRVLPFPRRPHAGAREDARRALRIADDEILVCSFGILARFKLNHRLLDAWGVAGLDRRPNFRLAFVGDVAGSGYAEILRKQIGSLGGRGQIEITGFAEPALYQTYLAAADIAVQLRHSSRGETSAGALDCLAHGIPLIINAHGSLAEIPDDVAVKLRDDFSDLDLAAALRSLSEDGDARARLAEKGLAYVRGRHDPAVVAERIHDAVEAFEETGPNGRLRRLLTGISQVPGVSEADLVAAAESVAANRREVRQNELLIDVTELARRDVRTGIQRVVRNLIDHLTASLEAPAAELVTVGTRMNYARSFAMRHFHLSPFGRGDEPVNPQRGDIFLGLDLNPPFPGEVLEMLRQRHVPSYFVVYDLLPILKPEFFPGISDLFPKWLTAVTQYADGLICISRAVADELLTWLDLTQPERLEPLKVGHFRLGADLDGGGGGQRPPGSEESAMLGLARSRPMVLMVGTLEPRKAHVPTLTAFEQLWERGVEVNLVLVGKIGWSMQDFVDRLRRHPEFGRRLFWFESASDAALNELYRAAKVLLAASFGEGFGLPLIEAAGYGLPILARDLPVFREVAGDNAAYFSGERPEDIATAVDAWLKRAATGDVPQSRGITAKSWAESTQDLLAVLKGGRWYRTWQPRDRAARA